jgi:TonB-dependent receptor
MIRLVTPVMSAGWTAKLARTVLLTGVSAFATGAFAAPAFAQADSQANATATQDPPGSAAAPSADDDAIVVTGIRASLERAIDIRRNSEGIVDAIVAEDIGKFPDTNLAESLQRIPGVSIDRVNGEGSQVTVRGFGAAFNLVTLNGRQMPAADVVTVGGDQNVDFGRATSRSFDFSNLASEGVSRLEVYKTGRAQVPSGGIGAAINVVTRRPLDTHTPGLSGSVGVRAQYDTSTSIQDTTPEVSGLMSWSNPNQTIGIALFAAYQRRNSEAASATSNDWNIRRYGDFINPANGFVNAQTQITNPPASPDTLVSVPNDSRYHFSRSEGERINGQAVLQFRPIETLTLTADALYVRNRTNEERADQTNWFNRPFRQVTFAGSPVATTVILQENETPVKDLGFEQQYRATRDDLQSFGLNLNWEISDGFTLRLDGHSSRARSLPDAPNGSSSTLVSFGAPVVSAHSVDYTGPIPIQRFTINDSFRGNNNGVLDLGDLGSQVGRTNASSQRHRINQARADLGWEFDDHGRLDIGANYIDSRMTSARVSTQQTLGDWGITRPGDIQQFAPGLVQQYCLACQFDHYTPGDADIAFRGNAVDILNGLSAGYAAAPFNHPIGITGNDFDQVHERIWSGYAQLTWNGELLGRRANLVAGVRYEQTRVESTGIVAQPTAIVWQSDNDFSRVVSNNSVTIVRGGEYDNLLPAIDFRIEPAHNVVFRASYSKTMARPDYNNLFVSDVANPPNRPTAIGGVPTGTSGNPGLLPLVSDNFDVALEWYFAPSSFINAGFFRKRVRNFVGIGQTNRSLFGLRDPSSGAAGSRSGAARTALTGLGADITDVNLFTMTALIIQNGGSVAAATAQFNANYAGGALNQGFVDAVLAAVDISGDANDPLYNFSVAEPINNREGNIHGFELSGQYFLGNTGFGIAASYTKVDGDVNIDVGADPNENQFALVGLSDSFNVTLIYDRNGLSARLAYNWRDKYLSATNRGSSRNPVFFAPFGTLDLSISYDISEQFAVSFDALNLTSEPIRSYGRDTTNLWFAQELHPRFFLGARFRF